MDKRPKISKIAADLQDTVECRNVVNTKDNKPILWPSERIPQGGMFHTPKVEYSKETADLLKLLMEESRMSMLMRKRINEHLRNGEPLPKPVSPRVFAKDPDAGALEILRRARKAKRKSLEQIMSSGIYDMPRYRPTPDDRVPSEKAKRQLQEAMAGLRLSETTLKAKRRPKPKNDAPVTPENIIDELLDQINERAEWLAEMEELGEGRQYRDEVRNQIAQKLRQIKSLELRVQLEKDGMRYIE